MVEIIKNGKRVATSRNLRGIVTRAGRVGMDLMSVDEIDADESGAIVRFWFSDGSWSIVSFGSFQVASNWVSKRGRRWDAQVNIHPVRKNPHVEETTMDGFWISTVALPDSWYGPNTFETMVFDRRVKDNNMRESFCLRAGSETDARANHAQAIQYVRETLSATN